MLLQNYSFTKLFPTSLALFCPVCRSQSRNKRFSTISWATLWRMAKLYSQFIIANISSSNQKCQGARQSATKYSRFENLITTSCNNHNIIIANGNILPNVSAVFSHTVFSENFTSSMAMSLKIELPTTPSNVTCNHKQ